jgi:proteasome lid subunit RPN8/RPN11/phage tail protein X
VGTFPALDALPDAPLVEPAAGSAIAEHVKRAPDGRAAGVLLGGRDDGRIRVVAAIPARRAESHGGEPVLPPQVWEEAYVEDGLPARHIIGWYHSHPPSGVGLSEYDRALHRVLFPDASSVALLIDPRTGRGRWYGWMLQRAVSRSESGAADWAAPFFLPRSIGRQHESERQRPRVVAAAILALGLVAAGGAGYGLAHWTDEGIQSSAAIDRLRAQLSRAHRGEQELVIGLTRTQDDLAASREEAAALRQQLQVTMRRLQASESRRPTGPAPTSTTYRIQPGDTLSRLAEAFYGKSSLWRRIWDANRSIIRDPDQLSAGLVIEIPLR